MQSLARDGYTAAQVGAALHAPQRELRFRYDLLDSSNAYKAVLTKVLAGHVENNALAQIKRTAHFKIEDDGAIDFLSDRIKPYAAIKMPDGGWAEWPLGVFLLSTPPRVADAAGVVTREVDAYDLLQVLRDDKVEDRYTVTVETNYIAAVRTVLDGAGIDDQNLTATSKTLPADRDWDPGTPKLEIVNDLLDAVNYRSLYFNEDGRAVAEPYVTPAERAPEYTYRDDADSVILPDVQEHLDLFEVPNKWVLVRSEPDLLILSSVYTNSNPDSPTSTVSRGRTIVDFRENVEAADQAALDALAVRLAYEASQVYRQAEFSTAIMPFHGDSDVLMLTYGALEISARFGEVAWGMDLRAGAVMKHRVRRVVPI